MPHRTVLVPVVAILALACGPEEPPPTPPCDRPPLLLLTDGQTTDLSLNALQVLTVEVTSSCATTSNLQARVEGDPAFTLGVAPETIGEVATVRVHALPVRVGPQTATLTVTDGEASASLDLAITPDPDQDGDGFDAVEAGGDDCDDDAPATWPGAVEQTDGRDNDCDGRVDEHLAGFGLVRVSEVFTRPTAGEPSDGMWLELVSTAPEDLPLQGWTVTLGETAYVVDTPVVLPSRGRVVLGREPAILQGRGVPVDGGLDGLPPDPGWSGIGIGADVTVFVEDDVSDARIPRGASLSLDPDTGTWCPATSLANGAERGTPGTVNDACDDPALADADGDGWSLAAGDCDDADRQISPGAQERWNGIDDDCDGLIDVTGALDLAAGALPLDGPLEARSYDLGAEGAQDILVREGDGWTLYGEGDLLDPTPTPVGVLLVDDPALEDGVFLPDRPVDLGADPAPDLALMGARPALYAVMLPPTDDFGFGDAQLVVRETERTDRAVDGDILDLDGDGLEEIVWALEGEGGVDVWALDERNGLLTAADLREVRWTGLAADAVTTGDTDGDGYEDLLLRDADDPTRLVLVRGDLGGTGDPASPDATFSVAAVGAPRPPSDLDGDGTAELVFWREDPSEILLFDADDTGRFGPDDAAARITPAAGLLRDHAVGDLDEDGQDDLVLLTGSGVGSAVSVLPGPVPTSGTTAAEDLAVGRLDGLLRALELVDLDGDGDLDLLLDAADPATGGRRILSLPRR